MKRSTSRVSRLHFDDECFPFKLAIGSASNDPRRRMFMVQTNLRDLYRNSAAVFSSSWWLLAHVAWCRLVEDPRSRPRSRNRRGVTSQSRLKREKTIPFPVNESNAGGFDFFVEGRCSQTQTHNNTTIITQSHNHKSQHLGRSRCSPSSTVATHFQNSPFKPLRSARQYVL